MTALLAAVFLENLAFRKEISSDGNVLQEFSPLLAVPLRVGVIYRM
jgi:hypothetical protein